MTMTLTDAFWSRYHTLIKDEMIPYQWSVLNDEADITIDKERDDDFIPSEKKSCAGKSENCSWKVEWASLRLAFPGF